MSKRSENEIWDKYIQFAMKALQTRNNLFENYILSQICAKPL